MGLAPIRRVDWVGWVGWDVVVVDAQECEADLGNIKSNNLD